MGRSEPTTGIQPFGRLVKQVLSQEPYHSAERLFWVVDNGSSHRGKASLQRIEKHEFEEIPLDHKVEAYVASSSRRVRPY